MATEREDFKKSWCAILDIFSQMLLQVVKHLLMCFGILVLRYRYVMTLGSVIDELL